MSELKHSYKGSTWKEHKYIAKKESRYIYDKKKMNQMSAEATWNANKEKAKIYTPTTSAQDEAEKIWKDNQQTAKTYKPNTNPNTLGSKVNKGKLFVKQYLHKLANKI